MTDYLKTVMRQYANSPAMAGLLQRFDAWVDPADFEAEFLRAVWDISTAEGFGLDIWGRILGQSRYLFVEQTPGINFGFNINAQPGTQWQPWNQAPWFNGSSGELVSQALEDEAFRKLLLVKAASNIASSSVTSINALMRAMFGDRGPCYVITDPAQPMHLSYYFGFEPTAVERAIIRSGLFPRPAGVIVTFDFL